MDGTIEILHALMALKDACRAAGTELRWNNVDDGGLRIVADIPLTEDQFQTIEDMRLLVGSV